MTKQSPTTAGLASSIRRLLDEFRQDLRDAIRSTIRTPVFLLGAVLSIALGIGANTCILSIFKATLPEKMLFQDPDRTVVIWTTPPLQSEAKENVSVPDYFILKSHNDLFDHVGALLAGTVNLGAEEGGRAAEQLAVQRFTASLFDVLHVAPERGRLVSDEDDKIDGLTLVGVISHSLWQTRFGGDPNIIGKTVLIDGRATNIVGVMPPDFSLFDEESEYWLPFNFSSTQLRQGTARVLTVVAHLKPSVSFQQAQAQMQGLGAELARLDPVRNKGRGLRLEPLRKAYFGDVWQLLLILEGAVGLILLLACANLAGLLLIRTSYKQREVAIRCSLGASRSRIVRHFLTESLLLSFAGGVLGVLLAAGALRILVASKPAWLSHIHRVAIDWPVLAVAVVLAILTGVVFGVGPARHIAQSDMWGTLRESAPSGTGSRKLQRALVTAQIAFAFVLLTGASLVVKSFVRLQASDLGFQPQHLLSFQSRVPAPQYFKSIVTEHGLRMDMSPVPAQLFDQVCQRLRTVPGIESAAGINLPPLNGLGMRTTFTIQGQEALNAKGGSDAEAFNAKYYFVTPDFFKTMRMTMIQGREFTENDTADVRWVAVVNQTMARQYWPNDNPIGQQITANIVPDEQPREIIGIVQDIPVTRWDRTPTPTLYVSQLQQPRLYRAPYAAQRFQMTFLLRVPGNPDTVLPFVRNVVTEVNPVLPVAHIQMVEDYLARQVDAPRYYMLFLGGFGLIALIMAAIGVYGVVAYSVARRSKEIAIRIALGAEKGRVLALIMRESSFLVLLGVPLGIAGALVLTRFIRAVLWGVSTTDPATFMGVPVLLLFVAIAASLIPTGRALRLDPREVLSNE